MATNKRKDAAALFELIDKSTLKVPKHAGALKIPDWWSSKTNPSTDNHAASNSTTADNAPKPSPPAPRAAAPAKSSPTNGSPATPAPARPEATTTARLFEPPPSDAPPSPSPSIRPPMPNGSPRTPATPPKTTIPEPSPVATTAPDIEPEDEPAAPPAGRQSPTGGPWPSRATPSWPPAGGRRARRPPWVIPAMIGVAILFVVIVIMVISALRHRDRPTGSATSTTNMPGNSSGDRSDNVGGGLLPAPGPHSTTPASGDNAIPPSPADTDNGGTTPPGENDTALTNGTPGKVYAAGTVQRLPTLYYVMISSTQLLSVAQKNADFLAQHGVDVSIEVVAGPGPKKTRLYKLISVKGFPTMVAAEPFRKQIVQIGHLHPDFKKYRKVWDDAFMTRVQSVN